MLCGTPLAETDEWDAAAELPPLPPLPDGGLSVTMPAWLRAEPGDPTPVLLTTNEEETAAPALLSRSPERADETALGDAAEPAPTDATPIEQPLGPQADPRTFLREEDFPRWLRELPSLSPRSTQPVTVITTPRLASTSPSASPASPSALPVSLSASRPELPEIPPQPQPMMEERSDAAAAAPPVPAGPAARTREAWETALLVLLVVAVVVAVIWALLVNGQIGSGL